MKKNDWISYLSCPNCKGSLGLIKTGLGCKKCKSVFPTRSGIPVFVDEMTISSHLKTQVEYFEKEDEKRGSFVLEDWQRRYVESFLKYCQVGPGDIVVDNATGSGYMAIELAKKGIRVIATDLTFKELLKLQMNIKELKLANNIYLVCAGSENLPLKNNIAKGMVANAILEHLPNENQAISEMTRVLKVGGYLMLAMPILMQYIFPLLWPINFLHDKKIGHLRRYSRYSIRQKFKGFSEISTYYTGSLFKITALAIYFLTRYKTIGKIAELLDAKVSWSPLWSSNVVSILKKL